MQLVLVRTGSGQVEEGCLGIYYWWPNCPVGVFAQAGVYLALESKLLRLGLDGIY